eukprot:TRINITY_DN3449_c0_g1_i2.p1 TRINITY_DN3449_c0_g1~~TRINITY_DN3449_c0_g1_i2.p1  ORF type:complete len:512 (-),score=71.10 TRINITY_DN3449_c0_g1_i2:50-1585(-)
MWSLSCTRAGPQECTASLRSTSGTGPLLWLTPFRAPTELVLAGSVSTFRTSSKRWTPKVPPLLCDSVILTSGEFYYDRATNVLSYIPLPSETDLDSLDVEVPQPLSLLHAVGDPTNNRFVMNVQFQDIAFEYAEVETEPCFASYCNGQSATFLTTAAIHLFGCKDWSFSHVEIAHVGGYGVWLEKGVFNTLIEKSQIHDLGAGGVRVGPAQGGVESNTLLRVVNNTITDCIIEYGGNYYQMGAGVLAQQVQSLNLQHNDIHYFYYTGVSVGWTWGYADTSVSDNLVAYNLIHHIGYGGLLSDMGCVYTLGHQPGTKIINNICHDVDSYGYGAWGLYTDEGSRDIELRDNVVYNVKCAGFHQHYGTDNIITNNIFADANTGGCDAAVRSSQWSGTCDQANPTGCCSSFKFTTNIVYAESGPMLYQTMDTGFVNMTLDYNTYWNVKSETQADFLGTSFTKYQSKFGKDQHSLLSDPQFVNPLNNDYSLQPTSPALALGFQPIDTSQVGPRLTV